MQTSGEKTGPPAGVVDSLTAAFELVTGHPWLIITPLALDVFLWVGPRLSVAGLMEELALDQTLQQMAGDLLGQLLALGPRINLFSSLSLPLVGVPALMGGAIPENTPISTVSVQVTSFTSWLGWFALLTMGGLLLASLYLGLIGQALRGPDSGLAVRGPLALAGRVLTLSRRLLVLGIVLLVLLIAVYVPLFPVALIAGLLGGNVLMTSVLIFGFVLVVFYLSMSVPGIFLYELPVVAAVLSSVRLVQRSLSGTAILFAVVLLIATGTNQLWHMADDGSWFTLVSIGGHAFISTALAVAIFVYYRERVKIEAGRATGAHPL
jgi:hypothetical protein